MQAERGRRARGGRLPAVRRDAALRAQPLTPNLVYKPAAPREQPGIVLKQFPARGTLSSHDEVTIVAAKALHGTVPSVVGLSLPRARETLTRRSLQVRVVRSPGGAAARVRFQVPKGGVAAEPGMDVRLVLARP